MGRLALRLAKAEALPYWSIVVETCACRMSFCCLPRVLRSRPATHDMCEGRGWTTRCSDQTGLETNHAACQDEKAGNLATDYSGGTELAGAALETICQ